MYRKKYRQERVAFYSFCPETLVPSEELFGSLPKGLFENLEGLGTTGQLAYHFLLDVDFSQLDNLKFESELKEKISVFSIMEKRI